MPLAGGTDLLSNMKRRQQVPRTLMSLRYVEKLEPRSVEQVRIASRRLPYAHRHRRGSPLSKRYDRSITAAALVATPHIRNMATLGGNSLPDTRCNYYDQNYENGEKRLIFA